jgi:hypothetical protein
LSIVGFWKNLPQFERRNRQEDSISYRLNHADRYLECGSAEDAPGSTDLFGGRLMQFDPKRDDGPRRGVDKQSTHFADRLPVSRNYRASSKVFIRNLHRQTSFQTIADGA